MDGTNGNTSTDQQPINEYEVALDYLTAELGSAKRETAIMVAKLATAANTEQRLRQQIIDHAGEQAN